MIKQSKKNYEVVKWWLDMMGWCVDEVYTNGFINLKYRFRNPYKNTTFEILILVPKDNVRFIDDEPLISGYTRKEVKRSV